MGNFSRDELEQAFQRYWRAGAVGEMRLDWGAAPVWARGGRSYAEGARMR